MEIFIAQHCKTATNVKVHSTSKNWKLKAKILLQPHFTLVIWMSMNKSNKKAIQIHELSEILQKGHYINYNTHTIFKAGKKKNLNN